jgi:phage tail sheath gpL-like
MATPAPILDLLRDAANLLKREPKAAITRLQEAYALAMGHNDQADNAMIEEELARAWSRRKRQSRAIYFAKRATKSLPTSRSAWATLAKTCELVAMRTAIHNTRRAAALYHAAARAFTQAATLTKDPEDRRWLQELARDAKSAGTKC